MKGFVADKFEVQAKKSAAKIALENDPLKVLAETKDSLKIEDQLAYNLSLTQLKTNLIDTLNNKLNQQELLSLQNEENTDTYRTKVNQIVNDEFVSLRESFDSPLFELDLRQKISSDLTKNINKYQTKFVNQQQKMLIAAKKNEGTQAAFSFAFNQSKENKQEFENFLKNNTDKTIQKHTLNEFNKFTNFARTETIDQLVGNKGSIFVAETLLAEEKKYAEQALKNKDFDALKVANGNYNKLLKYIGSSKSGEETANNRRLLNADEYENAETGKIAPELTTLNNVIDESISRGIIKSIDDLSILTDVSSAMAVELNMLPEQYKKIVEDKADYIKEYTAARLTHFANDPIAFDARYNNEPVSVIDSSGKIDQYLLDKRNGQLGLQDIKNLKSLMTDQEPLVQVSLFNQLLNNQDEQQILLNVKYIKGNLGDDAKDFLVMYQGLESAKLYDDFKIQENVFKGLQMQDIPNIPETEIQRNYLKDTRIGLFAMLEEELPANMIYSKDRTTELVAMKSTAISYLIGTHGLKPYQDYTQEQKENAINIATGTREIGGELVSGFIQEENVNFYLNRLDRKTEFDTPITDNMILESLSNTTDDILYEYSLRYDGNQFVKNTEEIFVQEAPYAVFVEEENSFELPTRKLTADHIKNYFTYKNLEKTDFINANLDLTNLPKNFNNYAVLVDQNGKLLTYKDGSPYIEDLKKKGYEYNSYLKPFISYGGSDEYINNRLIQGPLGAYAETFESIQKKTGVLKSPDKKTAKQILNESRGQ
jgi:hypothetical protein